MKNQLTSGYLKLGHVYYRTGPYMHNLVSKASSSSPENVGVSPWRTVFFVTKDACHLCFKQRSGHLRSENGLVLVMTARNTVWMFGMQYIVVRNGKPCQ